MFQTKIFRTRWLIAVVSLLFLGPVAFASAQDSRTVDVRFPRGSSGTTVSDSIAGYQTVNYRIGVSAGQTMSVQLDTDNPSNYFNINAPGASEAAYNSSIAGNSTNFRIPSSGNYIISVYLMRNAARRGESADFDLTLYVGGSATQAPRPTTLPSGPVAPIPVPSMDGGPDYWQVQGLGGSDTLNVRSGPSTTNSVVATVGNGDTLRNFGCTMNGSTRWCQVQTPRGQQGWVAGRYLHESIGQPSTLPTYNPRPLPQPVQRPVPVPYAPGPSAVSTSDMPRYCAGEASAKYGVRPTEITVNGVLDVGSNFVVQGWFDRADGTQFFNCYFGTDGSFQYVT